MTQLNQTPSEPSPSPVGSRKSYGLPLVLTATALLVPVAFGLLDPKTEPLVASPLSTRLTPGEAIFERLPEVLPAVDRPLITNVNVCDLDGDEQPELLVCDAVRHTVHWIRRTDDGEWRSQSLVPENSMAAPAHTAITDLDGDGDQDVVVAVLHSVWPTDSREGQVVALVNDGSMGFDVRLLADDLCRVTDVQPGDFDGDGDVDLAVAEFGYARGRVLWLENVGDGAFADHELSSLPGCIHVPVDDYDGDGDLDVAAVISQTDEEVWVFENQGHADFALQGRRVWGTSNFDLGLAGMKKCDLDQDGDADFLLSAGDSLELSFPCPQPVHGCIWLENTGDLTFAEHRIGQLGGTYDVEAVDLDQDGDLDVVMAAMFNEWKEEGATSLAWLENDGNQQFTPWHLADGPTHLCTVACQDLTGDGLPEVVAGSLQLYPPFDEPSCGLSIWQNTLNPVAEVTP